MIPIPEYSRYLIDSAGNVFSTISNKYMKQHISQVGYPAYTLIHDTKGKTTVPTHKILALAFIPNPYNKREVNHIDGVKTNNDLTNLEWVHGFENIRHAVGTKLISTSSEMLYEHIDSIVYRLTHDETTTWVSMANMYGYSDPSGLRKLVQRDYLRRGLAVEFEELCLKLRNRRSVLHSLNSKGRTAPNRKKVKVVGGKIYESLTAAAKDLGFTAPKACVAIKKGKPIKGYYLEYI